nr:PREDICTED: uncharacterized protein K02A2.6-like [Linepithema humile]
MANKGQDGPSITTAMSSKTYDDMTIPQLKSELKTHKLKTSGAKAELIRRLRRYDEDDDNDVESSNKSDESNDEFDETVINANERDEDKDDDKPMRRRGGDDGRNINQWIKEFDELAKLCEWSAVHQTIYARRLLIGSARLFVNHEVRGGTWKNIKTALKSEFAPKTDSHAVHMKLQKRKKKTDETYHQYCYKLLDIVSPINMETSAVIQYIIDGIVDDEISKTILYGAKTISQLKARLDTYELIKAKNKNANNVKVRSDDFRKRQLQASKTDENAKIKRCYNCGGKSHVSSACPLKEKGVLCFKCNGHGHIAANCTQSTKEKNCNAAQSKVENNLKVIRDKSKKIYKLVKTYNNEVNALFDSGSNISLMRAGFYVKIGAPSLVKQTIKFCGVGAAENVTLGRTYVKIETNGEYFEIDFHVVADALLNDDVLVGSDFLENVDMRIRGGKIISITKVENEANESLFVNKINVVTEANKVEVEHVKDSDYKKQFRQMILDYKPEKTKDVGIKLQIVVKNDVPMIQRARRLAPQELKIVDSQIQEWLEQGIIQSSCSNYASPIVLVKKKDGTTRLCVDYRKLNDKITKVRYPLPIIEDQIDRLHGARVFTTLDLENGFFHVAVEEDSRKYTAFIVPNGHYELLRMPFGLSTSPAYFQRYINAIFRELIAKGIVSVYMDDLTIPSSDCQEGLARLKTVLSVASEYGLAANWKKCHFLRTKVNYLGYVIEGGVVAPSEDKTKVIKNYPIPNDVKSVQSFLGLTGYFRKFVSGYATITRPLTDLIKKNIPNCIPTRQVKGSERS